VLAHPLYHELVKESRDLCKELHSILITPQSPFAASQIPDSGILLVYMAPGRYNWRTMKMYCDLDIPVLLVGKGPNTVVDFDEGDEVWFTSTNIVALHNLRIGTNTASIFCNKGTLVMDNVVQCLFRAKCWLFLFQYLF
jgi:hypothetical protein